MPASSRAWTSLAVVLLGLLAPAAHAAPAASPNIVFILVDDLRYNALGSTGHPFVRTPNIDRIAREGAVFRRAYVTTPLCSPSRSSYLTGRYVHSTRVVGNGNNNALSHTLVTFPRTLHDGGYETAYVGKWHMGNDDSPRPGFDRWVSFKGQGQYENPEINVDGQAKKVDGYMTDILNDHAVDFLKQKHERPFALYLAHKAVHGPFTPAERHRDLYADEAVKPSPSANDDLSGKPAIKRPLPEVPAKKAQPKKAAAKKAQNPGGGMLNTARNQLRCLQSIDDGVGRIFEALEAAGKLDDTLIVFTSDNGFFWGDHGLGDKRAAYEPSIRIPLLMRLPGRIKPGTTIDAPVLNVDMAPTFLSLAGLPVPKDVQGRSVLPLFDNPAAAWRTSYLTEYFMEPGFPRIPSWQAVSNDRYKLIHYTELDGMDELYDLKNDPDELKNLIADPAAQETLAGLKAELARLLKESDAPAAK